MKLDEEREPSSITEAWNSLHLQTTIGSGDQVVKTFLRKNVFTSYPIGSRVVSGEDQREPAHSIIYCLD